MAITTAEVLEKLEILKSRVEEITPEDVRRLNLSEEHKQRLRELLRDKPEKG